MDTNVVSEIRRSTPDPRVVAWFASVPAGSLWLSVLTIGEIHQGVVRLSRRDPTQAAAIGSWLEDLERSYAHRILDVTGAVARRWAELNSGRTLPVIDSLLAATAIEAGAALVTRNTRDLAGVGVELVNPFE